MAAGRGRGRPRDRPRGYARQRSLEARHGLTLTAPTGKYPSRNCERAPSSPAAPVASPVGAASSFSSAPTLERQRASARAEAHRCTDAPPGGSLSPSSLNTPPPANHEKEPLITIEVCPVPRPARFAAYVNGEHVATSAAPFLAAARKLAERGVAPETPIQMRHKGSEIVSLVSTVGHAAALRVREDADRGPRFVRRASPCGHVPPFYRPFAAPLSNSASPENAL